MNPITESSQILPYPKNPWDNNDNVIWLASRLKLVRNIQKFKYPGKLGNEQRLQILKLISNDVMKLSQLKDAQLLKADEISPVSKEYLYEHFLALESFHQAHKGEAFVIDKSGLFLAVINIRNHLQLALVDPAGELEKCWNQLSTIETELEKSLDFAFLPEYGFLTAEPSHSGTGLLGSVFLQVPALIHSNSLMPVLQNHENRNIVTTGLLGDPENLIGDILVVQNRYTLGVAEESIISNLRGFATQIMLEEKTARSRLKEGKARAAKDEVARAFALLKHSYQLETAEALQAVSRLKLGLDLGWVSGASVKDLNFLFFTCRRAHLLEEMEQNIPKEDLARRRAQYVHNHLKSVELQF